MAKMPEAIKSRVDNLGQRTSEEARDFAAAIFWIAAAFMGLRLASGIVNGRYRDLRPAPWREQVW